MVKTWTVGLHAAVHPRMNGMPAGSVALNADDAKRLVTTTGEGIFYNGATGRTADIYTEAEYGDCELHVEFMVPQGSNSGVYLMGRYEIQILDSWGETELSYGSCGGVYCRWIDNQPVDGVPPPCECK